MARGGGNTSGNLEELGVAEHVIKDVKLCCQDQELQRVMQYLKDTHALLSKALGGGYKAARNCSELGAQVLGLADTLTGLLKARDLELAFVTNTLNEVLPQATTDAKNAAIEARYRIKASQLLQGANK